jgi:hypothetical protein
MKINLSTICCNITCSAVSFTRLQVEVDIGQLTLEGGNFEPGVVHWIQNKRSKSGSDAGAMK